MPSSLCIFTVYKTLFFFNNNFQQQILRNTRHEPFKSTIFVRNAPHFSFRTQFFFSQRRFPSIFGAVTTGLHNFQRKPPRPLDRIKIIRQKRNNEKEKTEAFLSFYNHPIILCSSLTSTHQRSPLFTTTTRILQTCEPPFGEACVFFVFFCCRYILSTFYFYFIA